MANDRNWQKRTDEWVEMLNRSNSEKQKAFEESKQHSYSLSRWRSQRVRKLGSKP